MNLQIGVFGSASTTNKKYLDLAQETGKLLAENEVTIFCGNVTGILGATIKGAKLVNGKTVVVAPYDHKNLDLSNVDVYIASSLNWFSRGPSLVNSLNGIIVISGGVGTLTEMAYAWWEEVPIVIVRTGGINDQYIGKTFDPRKKHKLLGADTPKEAVDLLLKTISKRKS
ncbi:MAG: hypothetical protein Q8Q01_00345 [archaeon]|nr:hypothetical protein [archaeon]